MRSLDEGKQLGQQYEVQQTDYDTMVHFCVFQQIGRFNTLVSGLLSCLCVL